MEAAHFLTQEMRNNQFFLRFLLFLMIVGPIIGWILPADFFDNSSMIMCPSRAFFNFECLGCGMTRAVMHFHNLDFGGATFYNQFVWGVYPFLVFLWGKWTWQLYKNTFGRPAIQ